MVAVRAVAGAEPGADEGEEQGEVAAGDADGDLEVGPDAGLDLVGGEVLLGGQEGDPADEAGDDDAMGGVGRISMYVIWQNNTKGCPIYSQQADHEDGRKCNLLPPVHVQADDYRYWHCEYEHVSHT